MPPSSCTPKYGAHPATPLALPTHWWTALFPKSASAPTKHHCPKSAINCPCAAPTRARPETYQGMIEERFGVELDREGRVLNGLYVGEDKLVKAKQDDSWSHPFRGYVSPLIGSPFLSDERQFNLIAPHRPGAVDPMQDPRKPSPPSPPPRTSPPPFKSTSLRCSRMRTLPLPRPSRRRERPRPYHARPHRRSHRPIDGVPAPGNRAGDVCAV